MCQAIIELKQIAREEGERKGKREGERKGKRDGIKEGEKKGKLDTLLANIRSLNKTLVDL